MLLVFFCKQKTAYEMRMSDWSSDVCSSDLIQPHLGVVNGAVRAALAGISLASLVKPLPLAGGVWGGPVAATNPTNIPSPNPSATGEGRKEPDTTPRHSSTSNRHNQKRKQRHTHTTTEGPRHKKPPPHPRPSSNHPPST